MNVLSLSRSLGVVGGSSGTQTFLENLTVAASATVNDSINLTTQSLIKSVESNRTGWLVVYNSTTARDNDINRQITEDPLSDAGVFLEIVFTAAQTITLNPLVVVSNGSGTYPIRFTNTSVAANALLTFTYIGV